MASMNLLTFRKINNLSVIKLSTQLNISRQHLYDIEKGKAFPSRKLAKQIEDFTNGVVTAKELLGIH